MFFSISVALGVFQLKLAEAAFGSAKDVVHCHDLHRHGLGGR